MQNDKKYLPILDGWRALSILLVLAGHWLPLGPAEWQLNASVAASGMALFFCLSGFLITQFLSADPRVGVFLVKRIFRIIPLAWLAIAILVFFNQPSSFVTTANFLFFANMNPNALMVGGEHLWSLSVEMQFYFFMALLVLLAGRRAILLIPVSTLFITSLRIYANQPISIVTWHRVDEIFIGGCVALAWGSQNMRSRAVKFHPYLSIASLVGLFTVSLPQLDPLGYLRPYLAGATVFASLYAFPEGLYRFWTSRTAKYIAQISYAVYVFHGMLNATPLGGHNVSKIEKYLLRIPLAITTLVLSHISTFYYEKKAIALGNRLATKMVSSDQLVK